MKIIRAVSQSTFMYDKLVIFSRYENELIVATGKGNPALVMSEYGFK